jgi:hypothetical protein
MRQMMGIVIVLGLAAPANAQTTVQKNVMNHIAQALVVSNGCPSLKPRSRLMAMLLRENRIDIEKSPFREFMQDRGAHYTRQMANFKPEIVCHTGRFLYGDKGSNVPHLLED